jgi:hypothetical protein
LDAVWYQMLTGASCDRLKKRRFPRSLFGILIPAEQISLPQS